MNPVPFLLAAYGLGAACLLSFWCFLVLERRKLLAILSILKNEER